MFEIFYRTDGIFSTLWRRTIKSKKGEKIWIILDGPVDTIWVENLNSVLDDNKMLTLANGDRIHMSSDCKLVFETHSVDNVSPATISRNGMIYMSSSTIDFRPLVSCWLLSRSSSEAEIFSVLFESSFQLLLFYVRTSLEGKLKLLECNYVKQTLDLLTGLIPDGNANLAFTKEHKDLHLKRLYVFALMWSLGAILELDDRMRLQEKMSTIIDLPLPTLDVMTRNDTIYNYVVDEKGEWVHWQTRVKKYIFPVFTVPIYEDIFIPNIDSVRMDFLIDTIAKQRKPVLLIGEQCTGKTVIINNYCKKYNTEEHLFKSFNVSSTSTPNVFQRTIESFVDKRMGMTYGPPGGKNMTVFIDDINMPIIDEWGDQIGNEITRQCISMQGFYSLDKPGDFINLTGIQFLAAMPHPGNTSIYMYNIYKLFSYIYLEFFLTLSVFIFSEVVDEMIFLNGSNASFLFLTAPTLKMLQ